MGRAPCCEKVGLKKGRWTAEEDEILAKYIQANGEGSWRSLPKNAGLLRCGKSCRLRWINYLRTDLKRGNISAEEEDTIVKLHASFGNRWSLIASHLPGRTDNEIKNYWNSHLSRKIYRFQRVSNSETGVMDIPPPQRRGGRTSRWAMKKNKSYTAQKEKQIRPKQTVVSTQQQMNSEAAAVPVPPTPSLESEGLSNTVADFMLLEVEGVNKVDEPRKEEELELEVKRTHEKTCVDGEKETGDDDILGLFYEVEGRSINGDGGALCFSDMMMMESCLVEEACGVSELSEEREEGNDVVGVGEENERTERENITSIDACLDYNYKMASSSENLSSNGESGEWYCSPNWNWESVMEFDHDLNIIDDHEPDGCEYKENLLTWLWEDDDWESDGKKLGEIDPQRQNDMIAWFLS